MAKVYNTWADFTTALQSQVELTELEWKMLEEVLFSASIHAPFSKGDLDYALEKIKRIKFIMEVRR
ncbi:MAG: hypothetical protein CMI54_02850 [Parcubacteria group bacterium]|jgi:hypothetical protein|nr:hypothetical protein [Parcubacteria group bacterium]|tara:strand:+ start:8704 stop:8901 length:198 start_codon:yes stop_codon:yes gene_type:complete